MISSSSPWQASYISKHLHGFYADHSVCEREREREREWGRDNIVIYIII
jgi:hypothetical protein